MKRITLICLLLLSVTFGAMGGTPSVFTREITMTVGENITLRPYEIGFDKSEYDTYELSDPDAFTLSQGYHSNTAWGVHVRQYFYVLTALKKGTFTFTVTQFHTATWSGIDETAIIIYTITVNGIDATGISLNETEAIMCVGSEKQLEATVEPIYATDPSVSWMSTNEAVASVNNNGLVTAFSRGTTWIAATTNDGTNLTAMCKMIVKAAPTSLTLNCNEADVHLHQTLQLNATILPSDAHQQVEWSSSNNNVATVSESGLVTPVALGNAIIYAATVDGSNKKALCVITVLPAVAVGVQMNQTAAAMKVGQTFQLNATVSPADASQEVAWASSNTSVATVNENGLVTALNIGDATITAITKDGTNLSASCAVSVVPEFAGGISLNQSSVVLHFGESSQLMATINPSDASQEVTWTSSDPSVVDVDDDGLLFANGLGQATITATTNATTSNGTNLTANCNVNVVKRYFCDNDVNQDGVVTAADVTALYDYLLSGDKTYISSSDVNDDGTVTATDVTSVYEEILNGSNGNNNDNSVEFNVNGVTFKMIRVEGGTFTMGATPEQGSEAENDEKPAHDVTLSTFYICQTEVTQELWQAVMGSNPSPYSGTKLPVSNISWDNCQEFISNLNQITGKTFRLPTEAEWEYAARGGNKSQGYKYAGSNNVDEVAWYSSNTTHAVATKMPNELGLYDMSGNVWEWCQDWYNAIYYSLSPSTNPTGPSSGKKRVGRGGGVGFTATGCRVAYRDSNGPDADDGMRLVMSAE